MVRPVGFEPTTPKLKVSYSANWVMNALLKEHRQSTTFSPIVKGKFSGYRIRTDDLHVMSVTRWPLLQPAKFKERDQSTILSRFVKGESGASPETWTLLWGLQNPCIAIYACEAYLNILHYFFRISKALQPLLVIYLTLSMLINPLRIRYSS